MSLERKLKDKESKGFFKRLINNKWIRNTIYGLTAFFAVEGVDLLFNKNEVFGQTNQEKIVFTSNRDGNYEIYVMNLDGSNQINLTNNSKDDFYPSWSPDGSKIAFTSDKDATPYWYSHIYIMDSDGSNQIKLTNSLSYDPAWSPDGLKIAYHADTGDYGIHYEIYVMNSDGSNQTRITFLAHDYNGNPDWSPDGQKIAFTSIGGIRIMNADGSNLKKLTSYSDERTPSWSPDGSKFAFGSWRDGNPEIYVMDSDGSNIIRLTNNLAKDFGPAWSPDGSKIIFTSNRDGNDEIYVMDADGSNQTRITNNPAEDYDPEWLSLKPSLNLSLNQPAITDNNIAKNTTERKGIIKRIMDLILGFNPTSNKGYSTDATINLEFTGDTDQITKVTGYFSPVEIVYPSKQVEFNKTETGKYNQRIMVDNKTNLAIDAVLDAVNIISIAKTGSDIDLPLEIKNVSPTMILDSIVVALTTENKSFAINDTLPRWDKAMKTEVDHLFNELLGYSVDTRVYSPVKFLLTDPNGNKLGIENGNEFNNIPYAWFNQNIHPKSAIIFGNDTYKMELKATGTGTFDLKIYENELKSNKETKETSFANVNVTGSSKADIDIGHNVTDPVINLDTDGDGTIDNTINPEGKEKTSKIAFVSRRDGDSEIYIMNTNGTNVKRLTYKPPNFMPSWSFDGEIAFCSRRDGQYSEIYVMNIDRNNLKRLTNNSAQDNGPSWSPDGKKIVFDSDRHYKNQPQIYIMNADGSNQTRLTNNYRIDFDPDWSPDGRKIVFVRSYDICVIDTNGANQINLTNSSEREYSPAWSPDGKKIAFNFELGNGNYDIYMMNADGTNKKNLTNSSKLDEGSPSWSPDGSKIAFYADDENRYHNIYIINANGTNLIKLTDDSTYDICPAWSPFLDTPTSIKDIIKETKLPSEYKLFQNYPNPFNPNTTIQYYIPEMTDLELNIYNLLGQKIKTLFKGEQGKGLYSLIWNGKMDNGKFVPSGLYFYRLETDKAVETKKMLLIK